MKTAVAVTVFNQPEFSSAVMAEIAKARPPRLFVIADAPRHPGEADRCRAALEIATNATWPCEVRVLLAEKNLGPKARISSGLDEVFCHCEEVIFLEHDCVPSPEFFSFCEEMLERFREDERIVLIGGSNYLREKRRPRYSYYFSKYTNTWGWATWRRVWNFYDVAMTGWEDRMDRLQDAFDDECERAHFLKAFRKTCAGELNTWDYQLFYACLIRGGLSVVPSANLVSYIGFVPDALHTTDVHHPAAALPFGNLGPLVHPPTVQRDLARDRRVFDELYGGKGERRYFSWRWQTWRRVSRALVRAKKAILREPIVKAPL